MGGRISRSFLRLALLAVVSFLGLELALRVFQPASLDYYRKLKLLHVYHPEYLVGLAPDHDVRLKHHAGLWEGRFTTNSLGYRGSPEPDPQQPKVLCQGDSLVMGFGVSDDETFCSLLNGIELGGRKHQAMNLGVDAFGSKGNAARLAEAATQLKNIRVALVFISPNDFTIPPVLREQGIRPDDEIDAQREADPWFRELFRIQFKATQYSFLLHAASIAVSQARIQLQLARNQWIAGLVEAGLLKDPEDPRPPDKRFLEYLNDSFYRFNGPAPRAKDSATDASGAEGTQSEAVCPEPPPDPRMCEAAPPPLAELPPLPDLTQRAYDDMLATARAEGFTLLPVFLPVQMEELYCEMNDRYSRFSGHILRAQRYFRQRGVRTLDLRPYAKDMCGEQIPLPDGSRRPSRVTDYIIQGDGHLTELGNRWAARAIRTELQRLEAANAL